MTRKTQFQHHVPDSVQMSNHAPAEFEGARCEAAESGLDQPVVVPEEIILRPLTQYRDLLLYEPSPDEEQQIKTIGDRLRQVRMGQNLRRQELASLLHLDLELLTMVENGYGNLEMAQLVLRKAEVVLKDRLG